jgi:alkylation response protein AidB-like acyl-CoA dehydrogenase
MTIESRIRAFLEEGRLDLPFPGSGHTDRRHLALAEIARCDLQIGRLAEAHTDALAILHEAGREPKPKALYGVWASDTEGGTRVAEMRVSGEKSFCTGAGLVDCALVTVIEPERRLLEIDLRKNRDRVCFDTSGWTTDAFDQTATGTATFRDYPILETDLIGLPGWYLDRPGFWHGACGPAACWAGGALRLIDYAREHIRTTNPHALAHVGALIANAWQFHSLLQIAGTEIDADFTSYPGARIRALSLRHLVEQTCADTLLRFGRAFGPRPLAFDAEISRLHHELNLYIRQCHAESDLEELGRCC